MNQAIKMSAILLLGGGVLLSALGAGKMETVCHYMSWFQLRQEQGKLQIEHWKWQGKNLNHDPQQYPNGKLRDIYSVLYPRIGAYDSADPLVADYHILSAKTAGISAFVVDWYTPDGKEDQAYRVLLEESGKLGFSTAICYEEKTCFPGWTPVTTRAEAMAKAIKDFQYLRRYFEHPSYWKKNGRPVVPVFSGWGDWPGNGKKYFNEDEWRQILQAAGAENVTLVIQNFRPDLTGFKSYFAWCGPDEYLKWFYATGDALKKAGKIDFYLGSACPGFDDRGTWGWGNTPRFEPWLGTENLDRYLQYIDRSECDTVQIVTWNDFAEGTCIEPTAQFGQLFLERIAQWTSGRNGKTYQPGFTILPYRWFVLAKRFGQTDPGTIAAIRQMLAAGNYPDAAAAIDQLTVRHKFEIPAMLDRKNEPELFDPTKKGLTDAKTTAKISSVKE